MLLSSQFNQLTAHVITAVFMLKAADAERLLASRNDVVKNSLSKQSVILSELICEQPVFGAVAAVATAVAAAVADLATSPAASPLALLSGVAVTFLA